MIQEDWLALSAKFECKWLKNRRVMPAKLKTWPEPWETAVVDGQLQEAKVTAIHVPGSAPDIPSKFQLSALRA